MKNTLIILFFIFSTIASATDYYISSSGNDTNNGLSSSTPWKTIGKVNSAFSIMKPGDRILFNRGDTFYGTLKISKSGLSGSPIVIGAYGTGAKPIITGFTTVSSWTNLGSNIWESTSAVSTLSTCNMVIINGVNTGMGRYPNTGYLTYQTYSGNTSITSNSLSGTPNWTGAEVVIKKHRWIIDRNPIIGQSGGTLTYIPSSDYYGQNNWGFFIQNDARTLDTQNEWYYNPSTKKIRVYSTSSPISVKVASVDTLVFMTYKNYIIFDNISFRGANGEAFYIGSSSNITIQNSSIDFCYDGIYGQNWGGTGSPNFTLQNCTINHSNNNAVNLPYEFTNATVTNNIIKNTGMIAGMGGSGDLKSQGMSIAGTKSLIQYNEIDSTGYCGIRFTGDSVIVSNNFINYFCMIKDDGGGIYTYQNFASGSIISYNTVLNGTGNHEGASWAEGTTWASPSQAEGIYLDGSSSGIQILNNSVANIGQAGIFLNDADDIIIRNNTVYNSSITGLFVNNADAGTYITNLTIKNNIFFEKTSPTSDFNQLSSKFVTLHNDISSFGIIDSNYYARPIDDNLVLLTNPTGSTYTPGLYFLYNLAGWQTYSGFDAHSHKSPIALNDTADIDFYYNATAVNQAITLNQPMIDVKGTKYINSITLLPFTSVVLMVDPNPAQSVIPVYTGSIIENAAPSLLEMTYNVSLANIVPAASAFSVRVNTVVRTVNSVVISGTKIQLTLASPIISGDIVTLTYTTPPSNPLQTASGAIAVNISNQPVINNCINIAPSAVITSPITNSSFTALANIMITANASDPDDSVIIVEFYNGSTKLGSKSAAPYSFTWNNVAVGTYSLTVIAIDNLNAKTISSAIAISVNKGTTPVNQPPVVTISNPSKGNKYENPATITIDAVASDPDGTISKVEFYSGAVKLVELTSAPYSYTWKDVEAGSYSITAIATDNLNATATSLPIEFEVAANIKYDADSKIINLYPNPNDGHFSIEFINPLQNEKGEVVITDLTGKQVYNGPLSKEETIKQFDLSYIKSGFYILMIIYKEILVTKKIIKY